MTHRSTQQGFTAVELLITLFVAVAFIATAYQLYSAIVRDSGDARFRAKASNIAYAELRKKADDTTSGCVAESPASFPIPSGHGLDQPVGTITTTCRSADLAKIEAVVAYGPSTARKEVRHAIFVAK